MNFKLDKKIIISVATGLVGAIIVALVIFFSRSSDGKVSKEVVVEHLVKVYKLSKDLDADTLVTKDDLQNYFIPKDEFNDSFVVAIEQIKGVKTQRSIKEGELLKLNSFHIVEEKKIPEGYVAYTLKVDRISSLAWLVKPDDVVDILGVTKTNATKAKKLSTIVLQSITIFSVDFPKEDKNKKISDNATGTVTLLLTAQDATKLFLLNDAGKYTLMLRGDGNNEQWSDVKSVEIAQLQGEVLKKKTLPRHKFIEIVEVK